MLVVILDADKAGFLKSEISLIHTIGKAVINRDGQVILYADTIARSKAMDETAIRRAIQQKYNEEHEITPQTIKKEIRDVIELMKTVENEHGSKLTAVDIQKMIEGLRVEMLKAAENLEFERAAELRDQMQRMSKKLK